MNRKTLPRFLNKRYSVIKALVKARGNGGNTEDILYNDDSLVIANALFKNAPSCMVSTGRQRQNYKYSSKCRTDKKLEDRNIDIYEDDCCHLINPSTKKRKYQRK